MLVTTINNPNSGKFKHFKYFPQVNSKVGKLVSELIYEVHERSDAEVLLPRNMADNANVLASALVFDFLSKKDKSCADVFQKKAKAVSFCYPLVPILLRIISKISRF